MFITIRKYEKDRIQNTFLYSYLLVTPNKSYKSHLAIV